MARFCSGCGSPLGETAKFCRTCGLALPDPPTGTQQAGDSGGGGVPVAVGAAPVAPPRPAPVAYASPPQPAPTPEAVRALQELVNRLDLGQKFVAGGALAALIGFLLPQYEMGGGGLSMGGGYFVRLLFAVALLGLVYYRERVDAGRQILLAAVQIALASAYAIGILDLLSGGGYAAGFYIMTLGFAVAVAGAFMSIRPKGGAA